MIASTWQDRSPHTSGTAFVNNVHLHYLDWGGRGEPLILIHGLGDSPHIYDDLAPDWRNDFRVIAYARRGHDRSEAKGPFDVDTLTEDLRQLLDRLRLTRVHLAGWSLAGREITRFAELYPDRVQSLIYLDAAYDRMDPTWYRALENCPLKLFATGEALRSLDAYREWQRATWFSECPWPDAAEANLRATVLEEPDGTLRTIPSDSLIGEIVAANVGSQAYRRDYRSIVVPALFIFAASWLPTHLPEEAARRADIWTRQEYQPVKESTIARLRAELPAADIIELPSGSHMDFVFVHRGEIVKSLRTFAARRRDPKT